MTPEKYFLFARSDNGQYWPLDFKPTTLSRVRQLQRHMAPAFTPARDYVVATWDATTETFRAHADGESLAIHNPIYTAEAWDKFLADRPRVTGGR